MDNQLPDLVDLISSNRLLCGGQRTLVMLSGGGDSVALTDLASRICGLGQVLALHVNYGLRDAAAVDERYCAELCERLRIPLYTEQVTLPSTGGKTGNLQAEARAARYRVARDLAQREHCDAIAVAHTADDLAETVLYRLFSSPGRRALLGMPERRGLLVRPLLAVRRATLREYCRRRGLGWREDASNRDPRFARTRTRDLIAQAESIHPAAVWNIVATANQLRDESAELEAVAGELLESAVGEDEALSLAELAGMSPPLAGLVLRMYVEQRAGRPVPTVRGRVGELLALADRGGSRTLQVKGAALSVEYGRLRVVAGTGTDSAADLALTTAPGSAGLAVPGRTEFCGWRIEALAAGCEPTETLEAHGASLDLPEGVAGAGLTVRARRRGDRICPRGLGGSKSLQDLFVDFKVPRRLRAEYPVICAGDEIVWVPGVAVSEAATSACEVAVTTTYLTATPPGR